MQYSSCQSSQRIASILSVICFSHRPKKIVQFGSGNGLILDSLISSSELDCDILVFDLFDDKRFKFLTENVPDRNTVIEKGSIFDSSHKLEDNSIDLLFVDIGNDGQTYEYVVSEYMTKLTKYGVIVLEGGSSERDQVQWMTSFGKKAIKPFLTSLNTKYSNCDYLTISTWPSVTIIRKT